MEVAEIELPMVFVELKTNLDGSNTDDVKFKSIVDTCLKKHHLPNPIQIDSTQINLNEKKINIYRALLHAALNP